MGTKCFTLKLDGAPRGTSAILTLAKELEPAGLVAHWLQQKPNLVYLLELASDQLYRLSCKGGPSPEASSLIQLFLHYHCMGKGMYPPPQTTTVNIPISVDPEVSGIFDSLEWATVDLIMTVFRRAMCEVSPPSLIQKKEDGPDVLLLGATATLAKSLMHFVAEWWREEKNHGPGEMIPPFCALMPGLPCGAAAAGVGGGASRVEALFSAVMPGQLPGQAPAGPSSAKGASGNGRGGSSKAGNRGSKQVASGSIPQLSQELQAAETGCDLHLRSTLDLRGLVHACWCAISRGALWGVKYERDERHMKGPKLQLVLSRIDEMLHTLHLSNPTPITDPCQVLRIASTGTSRVLASARRGRATSNSSACSEDAGSSGSLYRSGHIWVPDTYSLGPAPALLAGANFTQFLLDISNQNQSCIPEVMTLIKYLTTLTRLAQAMATEAAGEHLSARIRQDEGAFRGWCASCDGLCDTAFYLLHIVGQVSGIDTTVTRYIVRLAKQQPPLQHQGVQDLIRQLTEETAAKAAGHLYLDPAVAALLPVMAASSLRLVHASLACVRLLKAQLKSGDLPPVSTTTAVSMVQAVRSALLMYEYVVQLAAMDAPHGANPTSKRAGLVTPSGAPVQAASSTAPLCSTVPAASSRSAATPTTPVVSKTNASRERASGGKGDVVSSEDLLPPDFQRHCAAVASWGPNLSCIMALATLSLRMMHRPCMLGNASHMLSWGKGNPCSSALYSPLLTFAESAASLLVKTDGDLAGWLGDLAPRGGLDPTQLLYRLCGSDTRHLSRAGVDHPEDSLNCLAVAALGSHGFLMLAAAFRMLCPPASAEGSKCPALVSPGAATSSSQGTCGGTETKGAGCTGGAGFEGGTLQRQTKGQDAPSTRRFLSINRDAAVYIKAWLQSPVSMEHFKTVCTIGSVGELARKCKSKVMEVVADRILQCVDSEMLSAMGIDLPDSMTLEAAIKDPTVIPKQQQQQQQQPHAHLSQHTSGTLDDIEPMHQLFLKEYQMMAETIHAAAGYRPKEAAQHSQRLQAYVEAAAARAAGQLEPGLKKELYQALGMPA